MSAGKRLKGRSKTPNRAQKQAKRSVGRPKAPTEAPKSAHYSVKKLSKKPVKKKFFLHYRKGKYNLVNLELKKKGHRQKYYV